MGAVTTAKRGASPDGVGEFSLEVFQGQVVAVLMLRLRSLGTQTETCRVFLDVRRLALEDAAPIAASIPSSRLRLIPVIWKHILNA
jgi:hypothetical protein